jgi:predicted ATPase
MAHLSRFGVGNFRAFNEPYHFNFSPITILTGTNSSGKSSLIKALLLLSKSDNIFNGLEFQSSLNLGNFDTVKNKLSGSDTVVIELPFIFPSTTAEFTLRLEYKATRNAIKNASLSSLKLLDLETNEVFIHFGRGPLANDSKKVSGKTIIDESAKYHYEEFFDELNVNFSGFWKIFMNWNTSKYCNQDKRLDNLTLYGPLFKLFRQTIISDAIKVDSLKQKPIYYEELDVKFRLKNAPLLNYLFLQNSVWVAENLVDLFPGKTNEEVSNLLSDLTELREKIRLLGENEKLTASEYILKKEIEFLDKKRFYDETRYEFPFLGYQAADPFWQMLKTLSGPSQSGLALELKKERNKIFGLEIKEEFIISSAIYSRIQGEEITANWEVFLKTLLADGFRKMTDKYKKILDRTHYVSSIRTKVDRFYRLSKGESELNDLLYEFHSIQISKESQEFLNKYLQHFGIADGTTIEVEGASYASNIQLQKGSSKSSLADMGYGISQLMPILLRIAIIITNRVDEIETDRYWPSMLIIEEPETNLHPQLQSKLADMFVECYTKYNIQLIIETHSEYLIRKLQYLTAKKDITPDLTQIYYFNSTATLAVGEKQVKKINIEEDGSLSDEFGKGFFDEADNIAIDLYNLNKRRN